VTAPALAGTACPRGGEASPLLVTCFGMLFSGAFDHIGR
jgi:hypothetical protein